MEVAYYVAASLDGYIATPEGGIDWLKPYETAHEDYGYAAFYASVDAVLMGSHTFEQCLTFDRWPYADKPCWVFSARRYGRVPPGVTITNEPPAQLLAGLRSQWLKRAWLVGGGKLAASFAAHELIDEYIVAVIPVLLGRGIPLLDGAPLRAELNLVDAKRYASGVMQLRYVSA